MIDQPQSEVATFSPDDRMIWILVSAFLTDIFPASVFALLCSPLYR
jgi:hypothetical protein